VVEVRADERRAVCESGAALDFGALVLAPGARPEPPSPHTITFGAPGSQAQLEALLANLRDGSCRDVVFLVPPETSWSLPPYELALMTAGEAPDGARVWLVSPERRPLAVFGPAVSADVAGCSTPPAFSSSALSAGAPEPRAVRFEGRLVEADAVVAPRGPAVRGVPADERGFIPTDDHGRVRGPGGGVRRGRRHGVPAQDATTGATALWSRPTKVAGLYLAPYLAGR
jgi:sulfide:quinone oxidoreductase